MKLFEMTQGEFFVLRPAGQLTSATSAEFEKEVRSRIEAGNRRLVLDLADLDYVSSAGLRSVLIAAKKANSADKTLVLVGMNAMVREVFRVSGFDRMLTIEPDAATAISLR